ATRGDELPSLDVPGLRLAYFIFVLVHFVAQFTVIGPSDPVIAIMGQETVLSCHLSPRMSALNMEVRWFQSEFSSFVHWYHDGKDQYEMQMSEYQGRTELLKAGLTDRNVALRILNIRHSDEGLYHCFVQDDTFDEVTVLDLQVTGSAPLISVESHQNGGIRVVCQSTDWYPESEVLWRDLSGRHLLSLSETTSQGDNGLFETKTAIIVTEHSNQNLSCCIRNTILNQDKESAISIACQALVGDWSCFEQGVGLDDLLRSLPTLIFYDSMSHSSGNLIPLIIFRLSKIWISCKFNVESDFPDTLEKNKGNKETTSLKSKKRSFQHFLEEIFIQSTDTFCSCNLKCTVNDFFLV
uniref:Ig-like domain-containing protein n=1 Tax=Gopherus evgoodei TaxID=1825980 RepID=A0A8C4WAS5_9SAUR